MEENIVAFPFFFIPFISNPGCLSLKVDPNILIPIVFLLSINLGYWEDQNETPKTSSQVCFQANCRYNWKGQLVFNTYWKYTVSRNFVCHLVHTNIGHIAISLCQWDNLMHNLLLACGKCQRIEQYVKFSAVNYLFQLNKFYNIQIYYSITFFLFFFAF